MSGLTEEVSLYRKVVPTKLEVVRGEPRLPLWRRFLCALEKHQLVNTGESFSRLELRVHDPLWVFEVMKNALYSEEDIKHIWKAMVTTQTVFILRCPCGAEFVRARAGKGFVRHFRSIGA